MLTSDKSHSKSASASLTESYFGIGDSKEVIDKTKIKFSDLNFVTDEGEIVKIAAIVSPYQKIKDEL